MRQNHYTINFEWISQKKLQKISSRQYKIRCTLPFFDVIEDMLHKYYETRFKKKVLDVISVSEEEYYANETNKDPQLVVSFNGDNISYKEENN